MERLAKRVEAVITTKRGYFKINGNGFGIGGPIVAYRHDGQVSMSTNCLAI